MPTLVAATLLEELTALAPEPRLLLEAAAIVGDPFEPELAYEVAELDSAVGVDSLDELLDAKLLHPTAVPRRFAFRHPLVRRAVYESARAGWRLGGHGRAAASMRARGASPVERAHHVEYSAVQGDADAITTLAEAAAVSETRSPQSAARWYAAALRLVPAEDGERRLDLTTKLAGSQRSTGDLAAASESLLTALELIPGDDRPGQLRLIAACAVCEHFLGRHEEAQTRLHAALGGLPGWLARRGGGTDRSGERCLLHHGDRAMCDFARRAVDGARGLGDDVLLFGALALLAHAESLSDRLAQAALQADEAEALVRDLADDALAARLDGVNRLGWAALGLERYEDAVAHAALGMRIARRTGQDQFAPLLLSAQALGRMFLGDLSAATPLATEALETARIAANDYVTCSVLTACCHVALAAGDIELARRHADESVERVELQPGRRIPTMAAARLAVLQREMGESGSPQQLTELGGGWDLPLIPLWRAGYLEALTRAALDDGDRDEAERFAGAAGAAGTAGLALDRAYGKRAMAEVRLASDEPGAAAELALESAAEADSVGAKREAARSRATAGLAQVAAGQRDAGIAALSGGGRTGRVRGRRVSRRGAARAAQAGSPRRDPRPRRGGRRGDGVTFDA